MRLSHRLAPCLAAALGLAPLAGHAQSVLRAGTPPSKTAAHEVRPYTIEDFLATTGMTGASFSPDKSKLLVSSDQTGIFNAYAVPVAGGAPVALTHSTTDNIMVRTYFPHDERFLYASDQGGNELTHLYVQGPDGQVTDVTPGDKLKAQFYGWADDDRSFFIGTNERDKRYFDIYEVTADGYQRTPVFQDSTGYNFSDISRDKRWLAFAKERTDHDTDIYLYDRQTQQMKHLTPHTGDAIFDPVTFGPDNKSLWFLTDEGGEFQRLVRQDLATGARQDVEKPAWDVSFASFSKHGKYLTVAINNDARTKLPDADITGLSISNDETAMAFYLNGSRSPNNLYAFDIGSGKPKQLTENLSPSIHAEDLVDAEVVRFKSYDGLEVPGLLYRPHQASEQAKVPALLSVHGGPGGQSRFGYNALVQYLVNHGYAVYAINNRGSSGYGKTFFAGDDHKHGDADLDDCVASKKMLTGTGYVDPARIGILGGSYGGYMVLAALAFRPEEFTVGVDLFGVANWVRTLTSIPSWWEAGRKAMYHELGDPTTEEQYLKDISPLFHASNIKRPLMVLQGKNDPRVLKVESDEIVAAAKTNGVPVEYVTFDDEGHGFVKKANKLVGYKGILDFCDKYLKSPAAVGVSKR
jgi:dipeptidyl aminopeptidase/acylaminoacyl peptidase